MRVNQSSDLLEKARSRSQSVHAVTLTRSGDGGNSGWGGIELLGRNKWDTTNAGSPTGSTASLWTHLPKDFNTSISKNSLSHRTPRVVVRYSDITRWQLALGFTHNNLQTLPKDTLTDRIPNLPRFQDYDHILPLFIGFGIVGLIYGGLHCVAWNAPFNTSIERILWRISSITIAATGVLVACLFSWTRIPPFWSGLNGLYLYDEIDDVLENMPDNKFLMWCTGRELHERLYDFLERNFLDPYRFSFAESLCRPILFLLILPAALLRVSTPLLYVLKIVLDILTPLFAVLYVLARIYLVVISFINLAHLPDSAYELPQWSRYVPHIG